MENIFYFIMIFLTANAVRAEESSGTTEIPKTHNCANSSGITVAVNLLDKDCIEQSGNGEMLLNENDNSIEVRDIEIDMYALCLLKKSSIMNAQGQVNLNFDIFKIVQHLYRRIDERGYALAFIIKSLEQCRQINEPDPLRTATRIMKCLLDNQRNLVHCDQH